MAGLIRWFWQKKKTHSFEESVVCYLSFSWFTYFLLSSSPVIIIYSTLQINVPRNPLVKHFSLFHLKWSYLNKKEVKN